MKSSFQIAAVRATPLNIPLFAPFGISGGAQAVANNVLVTLDLADGTRGYGEAAPLPPYNGETQDGATSTLQRAGAAVIGRVEQDWRAVARQFRAAGGGACGSAQCGFEMALLDALSRRAGESLWKFFGGAGSRLETDMTVTTGGVKEAAAAAQDIRDRGIRMIKVKIGGAGGAALDAARVAAIHAVAPDSPLILDGNAGLSREAARELARSLKAHGIVPALLEQWLPKTDLKGMRALHEETGWTVAADEAVTTADEAREVVAARAAQVINIKLMKAGILAAWEIVAVAREARLGLMIGGNVESILAMTTSACFAAGLGGFTFADLDTPFFLSENPFEGGYAVNGGELSVAHIARGHGVTPK
ncbi:MAG: hypothetical protein RIQ93_3492 [Verrucomicrobiota bacterium]|jgi:L-alanine-DL-glutamate epimerase-like enolase superfamily enzyme